MPVAIKKVRAEYHDPVGIFRAMNSSTTECCYKLDYI